MSSEVAAPERHWRARVAILTLGVFAVGTDGFVIVGLLPAINKTLGVSISAAGQLVSAFSIAYAVVGPILATVTGKWPRKRVLVSAVALLAVGNAVTALAGDYALVVASRVVAGSGAALFIASAVATAAHIAGEQRRGSAIAMVTAGSTLSLVLGAPLGTVVGGAWGWQAAIWLVAGIAAAVAVTIALLLPDIRVDQDTTIKQRVKPLTDPRVLKILAVTLLAFIGIYLPFTYMSAVFAPAIGGDQDRIALLLLLFGIAATAGNLTAGSLADKRGPRSVVTCATVGVAAVFLLMLPIRDTFSLVAIAHVFSGLFSFSVIGPQQQRIIKYAPSGGVPLVTSLNTSTAYLGNFLSSVLGGAIIAAASGSAAVLLPIAAASGLLAASLTWWFGRSEKAVEAKAAATAGT